MSETVLWVLVIVFGGLLAGWAVVEAVRAEMEERRWRRRFLDEQALLRIKQARYGSHDER